MRTIVVSEFAWLDGVMEDPGWTMAYWNNEIAGVRVDELFASDAKPKGPKANGSGPSYSIDALALLPGKGVFEDESFDFKEMLPGTRNDRNKDRLRKAPCAA